MSSKGFILVTGGTGFIGSHICVELLHAGWSVVMLDNLQNSKPYVVDRVRSLTQECAGELVFVNCDLRLGKYSSEADLDAAFANRNVQAVIHCAGYKNVHESSDIPLEYYENNLVSTFNVLHAMKRFKVNRLLFSSSCTVYARSAIPFLETTEPVGLPINPYGCTKAFIERILTDYVKATPGFQCVLLRYFNPVGAHPSGLLGEDPKVINNLLPLIFDVIRGRRKQIEVFGTDYNTRDGTCERDFIHVVDVAQGHVAALAMEKPGVHIYNLGTGLAVSVKEMIEMVTEVTGVPVKHVFGPRRDGDLPCAFCDPKKCKDELGWVAKKTLRDICTDGWRFVSTMKDEQ